MALNNQSVAELVRLRLNLPDGSSAPRFIFLIPEALKAMARKVAADPKLRNLLLTDRRVAVLPIVNGKVDLANGFDNFRFLLEYLENGTIYHISSEFPLQPTSALQAAMVSSYMTNNFGSYYLQGDDLVPAISLASNLVIASGSVNAGTDLFTSNAHGLVTGQAVTLSSSGGLPAGLAAGTVYFAVVIDANTFKLASSYANAVAGTVIDLTTAGSGNHTVNPNTIGFAIPSFPADVTQMPESRELEKMLIDKLIEMLPEVGGSDYAQDGEK